MLILVLMACKSVDPAPPALDDLVHDFWVGFDDATDEELLDSVALLHDQLKLDPEDKHVDGSVSSLSDEEMDYAGGGTGNPNRANGVYIAGNLDCPFGQIDEILSYKEQDELYVGVYDSYERNYVNSREDYLAGDSSTLEWDVTYGATVIGVSYEADMRVALRRVDDGSKHAPLIVAHSYATSPARFDNDNKSIDQDYQMEVYWTPPNGEVFHLYAIWREADFGIGLTSDDEGVQRILINGMVDWDEGTEQLCEMGLP